jgi:hypothetical protein
VAHTCSIWEVEIRKIEVQDQPGQIVQEILWTAARVQVVEHLLWKCKALQSTKKKIKKRTLMYRTETFYFPKVVLHHQSHCCVLMDLNASQWCGLMDKRIHFKVKQV